MALRDFYSLNQTLVESTTERLVPALAVPESMDLANHQPDRCLVEAETVEVLPSTQRLALEMEQHRQKLLAILMEHPLAFKLLTELVSSSSGEGVDFSVQCNDKNLYKQAIQDNRFVQAEASPLYFVGEQATPESTDSAPAFRRGEFSGIHFFPALLIRISEQIQKTTGNVIFVDSGYKIRLLECRRRLQDIRQKIISSNTGLVAFVAYKHKTNSLSFDDLMQEGIVGLIRAVDRFDPNRGICFSTYAVFWIKQAISRLIMKQEKVVRLPVALAEKASVVFEVMRCCYLENNRWPTVAELQAQCCLTTDEVKTVSSYYQATHSLDAAVSEENDDFTLMDSMQQQQFALPLNELIDRNLNLYIDNVVASLPEKEAAILNMRFGLRNHTEMTLQAIADQLHVTRERVRQIQNQALNKLKQQFGYDLLPFLEANDG